MTKYDYNEDFFDKIEEPQGWVLGWIASDGHVAKDKKKYNIQFGLQLRDKYILEKIGLLLRNDKKICYPKRPNEVTLDITNKKIVEDVIALGIPRGKKSDIIKPLDLPEKAIPSFWQGMFEGDGSIYYDSPTRNPTVQLTGNEYICQGFSDYLGIGNVTTSHTCHRVRFYLNQKRFPRIYNSLYPEYNLRNNLILDRKHQKFIDAFYNFNT